MRPGTPPQLQLMRSGSSTPYTIMQALCMGGLPSTSTVGVLGAISAEGPTPSASPAANTDHRPEVLSRGGGFWPGTGKAEEVGGPGARGLTVNIAWPKGGLGTADYLAAFELVRCCLLRPPLAGCACHAQHLAGCGRVVHSCIAPGCSCAQ